MRTVIVTCGIVLLSLATATRSNAAPVYVTNGQAGWTDVNKVSVNGPPDSFLCWAATASDALAWAGWRGWDSGANAYISTPTDIYDEFLATWGNAVGAMVYGYEWWMKDDAVSTFNAAKALPPGKNFYPGNIVGFIPGTVTNFTQAGSNIFNALDGYITDDRGIVASIDVPNGPGLVGPYKHALAVWGWDTVANQIFLTDPDDGLTALKTYSFSVGANGAMTILNYSNLYTQATNVTISELTRLNRNINNIEPNKGITVDAVPEPASLTLLGLGLLYGSYRKRRSSRRIHL